MGLVNNTGHLATLNFFKLVLNDRTLMFVASFKLLNLACDELRLDSG